MACRMKYSPTKSRTLKLSPAILDWRTCTIWISTGFQKPLGTPGKQISLLSFLVVDVDMTDSWVYLHVMLPLMNMWYHGQFLDAIRCGSVVLEPEVRLAFD